MNPFLNLLFLLLFTVSVFYFLVDVSGKSYLRDKVIIFVCMFLFQFSLMIISSVINKCKIDFYRIINECLKVAFIGVIGYSIYIDLTIMDTTRDIFEHNPLSGHKSIWLATGTVFLLLTLTKTIQLLLQPKQTC